MPSIEHSSWNWRDEYRLLEALYRMSEHDDDTAWWDGIDWEYGHTDRESGCVDYDLMIQERSVSD